MKIGFVSPRYYPYKGGIETLVQAIGEQMVTLGHTVDVLTLIDSDQIPKIETINGVTVRRFKKWIPGDVFLVGLPLLFYLSANRRDYEIVNAHSYHALPLFWCSVVCPDRHIASTHYHGKGHSRLADRLHPIYRPFGSWAVRRAQKVICASNFERELVHTHFHVDEGKIAVVPDGIPLAALQSAAPIDLPGIPLLYVGRLERYKRVDLAISALTCLPENYRLYVIGNGSEEEALRKQTTEAQLTERVSFLKNISDSELYQWYQGAKVLVMMSEAESFPMTSLEAMAAGCRVVCGSSPPFTELAKQYPEQIFITHDTSPQALADQIVKAANLTGRAEADLAEYSWSAVAQTTLGIFETVVSTHMGSNP